MKQLGLYLVTDAVLLEGRDFIRCIEEALQGGVQTVQLREKSCGGKEFFEKALALRELTKKYHATFIVNDRVDIAMAVDADGVHVGQSDLAVSYVRQLVGPTKIVGVSAKNKQEAMKAERDGADYVGVGAMFPTKTKSDADDVSFIELEQILATITIPTVVIGGITIENVKRFDGYKINGVAVVSAILQSKEIEETSKEWRRVLGDLTLA